MSFHFSPKLVTDGLIWAVDAANNASYNGVTNTWNDLTINNQNLILLSGSGAVKSLPVYNPNNLGNFFFNWTGSTSYMSGSYAINTGQNFSVFAWIYPTIGLTGPTSVTTSRGMILNTSYAYQNGFKDGWTIGMGSNNTPTDSEFYKFFFTTGRNINGTDDANYKVVATGSFLNQWSYMGVTIANSANAFGDMLLYRNGNNIIHSGQRVQVSTPISYSFANTVLGARYDLTLPDWFPGYIAAAHIYNRVLTPQEVGQNYNAYKARFGLVQ